MVLCSGDSFLVILDRTNIGVDGYSNTTCFCGAVYRVEQKWSIEGYESNGIVRVHRDINYLIGLF